MGLGSACLPASPAQSSMETVELKTEEGEKFISPSFVGLQEKITGHGGKLLFVLVVLFFSKSLLCHNYEHCTKSLDVCNDCISNSSAIKPLLKAICMGYSNNNQRGRLP